jgi:hypothetical protein
MISTMWLFQALLWQLQQRSISPPGEMENSKVGMVCIAFFPSPSLSLSRSLFPTSFQVSPERQVAFKLDCDLGAVEGGVAAGQAREPLVRLV